MEFGLISPKEFLGAALSLESAQNTEGQNWWVGAPLMVKLYSEE